MPRPFAASKFFWNKRIFYYSLNTVMELKGDGLSRIKRSGATI